MRVKIKSSKPVRDIYSCGHPVDGTLSCWRCTIKRLKERYYGSNQKENQMKLTIKKTTMKEVLAEPVKKAEPAPVKAKAAKTAKAPAPAKAKAEVHHHRKTSVVGKKFKLSINHTWVKLFSENEELAAKGKKPLTDEKISETLHAEFPGRKTKAFDSVSSVRSRYNHGLLSQDAPPKVKSKAYNG